MKITSVILLLASLGISQEAFSWGKTGHDAIAYIAECNLSPTAKKNIEKYLHHSIVYYASWMDEYRHTPEYVHTTKWHTAHVDENFEYLPQEKGDAISCLENAISMLKDYKSLNDSTVAVNLKYIIHLVGDTHCPVHVKYPNVKSFNVILLGNKYSYHHVWDAQVLDVSHQWGYMEYQQQLDRYSKEEKKQIMKASPREWLHENAVESRYIYDIASPNCELGKDFINHTHEYAEKQVVRAGYRLANILNSLFGK